MWVISPFPVKVTIQIPLNSQYWVTQTRKKGKTALQVAPVTHICVCASHTADAVEGGCILVRPPWQFVHLRGQKCVESLHKRLQSQCFFTTSKSRTCRLQRHVFTISYHPPLLTPPELSEQLGVGYGGHQWLIRSSRYAVRFRAWFPRDGCGKCCFLLSYLACADLLSVGGEFIPSSVSARSLPRPIRQLAPAITMSLRHREALKYRKAEQGENEIRK